MPKKSTALTTSDVKKIVKKTMKTEDETKSFLYNSPSSFSWLDGYLYHLNPMAPIAQGTTNTSVVGTQMFIKNIRMKGCITATNVNNQNDTVYRLCVVETDQQLTNSPSFALEVTNTNYTRVGATSGNCIPAWHLDTRKVKIHYDKTFLIKNPGLTTGVGRHIVDLNIKFNRKFSYESNNGIYSDKGKNIYILLMGYNTNDGASSIGTFVYEYAVNFKDS